MRAGILERLSKVVHKKIVLNIQNVIMSMINNFILFPIKNYTAEISNGFSLEKLDCLMIKNPEERR